MKSSSSSFETIMEALLKQKQVLENLLAENEDLHQQLADLRAGRGMFVDLLGVRIPLASTPDDHTVDVVSNGNIHAVDTIDDTMPVPAVMSATETDTSLEETTALQAQDADPALQPTTAFAAAAADFSLQPTAAIPGEDLQTAGRESPLPGNDFVIEDVSESEVISPLHPSSTFLEDALFAEFSSASTRHVGNWSGSITNVPITNNPVLNEDEKAALRRQLMGSYILE